VTDEGVRHEQARTAKWYEARRALNNGSGDAQARAFELALTPAIMGFVGFWIDKWLGTTPLFLIAFVLFTVSYLGWKFYVRYDAEMREHEAQLFGTKGNRR
jgi:F0F1-type ATP synthase assembly protein I